MHLPQLRSRDVFPRIVPMLACLKVSHPDATFSHGSSKFVIVALLRLALAHIASHAQPAILLYWTLSCVLP